MSNASTAVEFEQSQTSLDEAFLGFAKDPTSEASRNAIWLFAEERWEKLSGAWKHGLRSTAMKEEAHDRVMDQFLKSLKFGRLHRETGEDAADAGEIFARYVERHQNGSGPTAGELGGRIFTLLRSRLHDFWEATNRVKTEVQFGEHATFAAIEPADDPEESPYLAFKPLCSVRVDSDDETSEEAVQQDLVTIRNWLEAANAGTKTGGKRAIGLALAAFIKAGYLPVALCHAIEQEFRDFDSTTDDELRDFFRILESPREELSELLQNTSDHDRQNEDFHDKFRRWIAGSLPEGEGDIAFVSNVLTNECWRLFEFQCSGWAIIDPAPGPGFWDRWMAKARDEFRCGTDQPIPFPDEEISLLLSRRPEIPQRLFLLAFSGLWPRVPDQHWFDWVNRDPAVDAPFPPDELRTDEANERRLSVLAESIRHQGVDKLRRYWSRCRYHLARLPSIRRLIVRRS